jgi:hypothetical protein
LNRPCIAKLAAGRHTILKEGLTRQAEPRVAHGSSIERAIDRQAAPRNLPFRVAYSKIDSATVVDVPARASSMTLFSTAHSIAQGSRRRRRSHMIPIAVASAIGAAAIALIAYLLWPTWSTDVSSDPARLPVSIGGTLFNMPPMAIRMKVQRHSGPQERVDLDFAYPSLEVPEGPKHVSADTVADAIQPIDRIFLSIAAHHDSMAPDVRMNTIYPHYLEPTAAPAQDGLTLRAFRDGTPYSGEDLLFAENQLGARCTRDGRTPGMCLSERRIDGADLTFRFPRSWLAQWRDVAAAMDRLTLQLRGAKSNPSPG